MKKYVFLFNPHSERYGYFDRNDNWIEFTSGSYIELEYKDIVLKSSIEADREYYLVEYKDIPLEKLAKKSYVLAETSYP